MDNREPTADELIEDVRVTGDSVEISLKENSYVTTIIHPAGVSREIIPDEAYWAQVRQNGIMAGLIDNSVIQAPSQQTKDEAVQQAATQQAAVLLDARDATIRQRETLAKARAAKAAKKGTDGEASA
jgi:hypothetical protein